jgi:hypothetical protein
MVSAEEEAKIGYYADKKMTLKPAVKDDKKAAVKGETVKEAFEAAKPDEPQLNAVDVMEAVKAARMAAKAKSGEEGISAKGKKEDEGSEGKAAKGKAKKETVEAGAKEEGMEAKAGEGKAKESGEEGTDGKGVDE